MNRWVQWLRRIPPRPYLTIGLASLVVTMVLAADALGLLPDAQATARRQRAELAETVAIAVSNAIDLDHLDSMAAMLAFIRDRNGSLLSIGVRGADDQLLVDAGDHENHWRGLAGNAHSTQDSLTVPLVRQDERVGAVELQFTELRAAGWRGWLQDPTWQLVLFMLVASLLGFYLYLGRMLQHLDPSRSVPGRVRHALDALTEGLLVLDGRGRIMLANQSLSNVLGESPQALVGREADHLGWQTTEDTPLSSSALPWHLALQTAQVQRNVPLHLSSPQGQRYALRSNCSPIVGPGGDIQGVLVSLQDVTALEEKEVALQAAKEEADQANQAKSRFLANMSHEIRTPMNAILGFTEVLMRGGLRRGPDAARHLEIIHSSGRHLLTLINDILDLSKVEAGRLEAECIPYAPHTVMHEVSDTLAVRARDKGLALQVEFDEALPAQLHGDPARLRQILTNLVGNAIKFTDRGQVTVRARLAHDGEGATRYRIDVADSGVGIAADRLEAVFEPFVQAEASTARRFGGTGLGLTISRGFARAMGGDITVSSTPGQGTTFTVDLPVQEPVERLTPHQLAQHEQARPSLAAAGWHFAGATVLVVDDAQENRQLLTVMLGEVGLRVVEACDGQEGVDRAAAGGVDLVLMDMQMPVMDGLAATREIRRRGLRLPVLALTANAMKGFESELTEAGFDGYHTKPIDLDTLMADLAARLGGQRRSESAGLGSSTGLGELAAHSDRDAGTEPVKATSAATIAIDGATPIISRLATHPRLAGVARRFAMQLPDKLDQMRGALATNDFANLAALAHWLKGAGGSMGYDALHEPSLALEDAAKAADAIVAKSALDMLEALQKRILLSIDVEQLPTPDTLPS